MIDKNIFLKIGCYKEYYTKYNEVVDITINLKKAPHVLICGSSGSGKSYALNKYIEQLIAQNVSLYVADFKNELNCSINDDVFNVVESFYDIYKDKSFFKLLVIDEYVTYLKFLKIRDKDKYNKMLIMISEMLMLARSYNSCVFICVQRADAEFFSSGARDNFFVFLAFGNISKESKMMMFDNVDLEAENFFVGEGLFKTSNKLVEFKVLE